MSTSKNENTTQTTLTDKYTYDELILETKSKSAMIRRLYSEGYKKGEIAKFMNIIYQFVYNVIANDELKKKAATK